jgi:hypothetical protein
MMSSCATAQTDSKLGTVANVDLRVSQGPNDDSRTYATVQSFEVPATHTIQDKMFPYEGIGWENDLIGHRIYLDERSVGDVFGKKTPGVALPGVDYRSKYHEMADWGMDVMHVGPSLGIGGLGLYRDGKLSRFGKDARLKAEVLQGNGKAIAFKLVHDAVPLTGVAKAKVEAVYSMKVGSPLTWVQVSSDAPSGTLATGLVTHAKAKTISASTPVNGWTYIAQWGPWSLNNDELGIVLFYKTSDARRMPEESETQPIRFTTASPRYAFTAVWAKGPQGIDTEEEFRDFLGKTLKQVAQN